MLHTQLGLWMSAKYVVVGKTHAGTDKSVQKNKICHAG